MEERPINKGIKEVMDEYPFRKSPLIGVYGVDNENIKVVYLYEKDGEGLGTDMDDMTYHGFKPVDHVYNILVKDYKPFYILDYVHAECQKEIERVFENLDDMYLEQYHYGRRIYFEYCKGHGIDTPCIQRLTGDKEFCPIERCLKNFEKQLSGQVDEKMKKCGHIEAVTLKNYKHLLNEFFYNDLALGCTLEDESRTIFFFPYDSPPIALIRDEKYPFIRDLQDWGFDLETDLLNVLQSGATIRFMSLETHEDIIVGLEIVSKAKYDSKTQEGTKKYLRYCKKSHIHVYLPGESKVKLRNLFQTYEISKSGCAEHERQKRR